MERRRGSILVAAAIAASVASFAVAGETPWWSLPDGSPTRTALGDLSAARAVAVARGGRPALAAFPAGKNGEDSRVVVLGADSDTVESVEIAGEVRSIRLVGERDDVVFVLARRAKRRAPETHLYSLDLATLRSRRLIHLPHTSADVTEAEPGTLVVACRDELRTFTYPELTSGPLYRLLGDNRAIAHLRDSRFVVANSRGLVIVDLDDPPGKDEMPVRATLDPDGGVAALGMLDDPPRVTVLPGGGAPPAEWAVPEDRDRPPETVPAAAVEPQPTPAESVAPPVVAEIHEPSPVETPVPRAVDVRRRPPVAPPAAETVGAETTSTPEPAAAVPEPPPISTAPPDRAVGEPAAEPEATADGETTPSVRGTISGALSHAVRWVVAFGPNNVIREAARVAPRPDGSYRFDDLAPGSYRLTLDGGGDRVVESEPAFQVVRIDDAGGAEVATFVVVRVR